MSTAALRTKRKNIDIREDVFHYLSIKAAISGTNLKNYIETLLEKDVEDMNETSLFEYLSKTRPEGNVMLNDKQTEDFGNWLKL